MRWTHIRKIAVSLTSAIIAAVLMVSINEAGYARSLKALDTLTQTQNTRAKINQLMQLMLDAETGLRGYLLTGEERYLEPYSTSTVAINGTMDDLRKLAAALRQEGISLCIDLVCNHTAQEHEWAHRAMAGLICRPERALSRVFVSKLRRVTPAHLAGFAAG